ncbi:MAG: type ISP restriction/modification enzyme [Candidatus Omnitrophota bacterium]
MTMANAKYKDFIAMPKIFPDHGTGIVAGRDSFCYSFSPGEMYKRIKDFASMDPEDARIKFELYGDTHDWAVSKARQGVLETHTDPRLITPILYRPFDVRYTYYYPKSRRFLCMPRPAISKHMMFENMALVTMAQVPNGDFNHALISECMVDAKLGTASKGICYIFPLYLYEKGTLKKNQFPTPNLGILFLSLMKQEFGYPEIPTPEQLLHYVYAILFSQTYRNRYKEELMYNFPSIPFPRNYDLFIRIGELGEKLKLIHLLRSPEINGEEVQFSGTPIKIGQFQFIGSKNHEGKIYLDERRQSYFTGIEKKEWDYKLMGYKVIDKYLRSRSGLDLTADNISHLQCMISAIRLTMKYQRLIDDLYPEIETDLLVISR